MSFAINHNMALKIVLLQIQKEVQADRPWANALGCAQGAFDVVIGNCKIPEFAISISMKFAI